MLYCWDGWTCEALLRRLKVADRIDGEWFWCGDVDSTVILIFVCHTVDSRGRKVVFYESRIEDFCEDNKEDEKIATDIVADLVGHHNECFVRSFYATVSPTANPDFQTVLSFYPRVVEFDGRVVAGDEDTNLYSLIETVLKPVGGDDTWFYYPFVGVEEDRKFANSIAENLREQLREGGEEVDDFMQTDEENDADTVTVTDTVEPDLDSETESDSDSIHSDSSSVRSHLSSHTNTSASTVVHGNRSPPVSPGNFKKRRDDEGSLFPERTEELLELLEEAAPIDTSTPVFVRFEFEGKAIGNRQEDMREFAKSGELTSFMAMGEKMQPVKIGVVVAVKSIISSFAASQVSRATSLAHGSSRFSPLLPSVAPLCAQLLLFLCMAHSRALHGRRSIGCRTCR